MYVSCDNDNNNCNCEHELTPSHVASCINNIDINKKPEKSPAQNSFFSGGVIAIIVLLLLLIIILIGFLIFYYKGRQSERKEYKIYI